MFQKLFLRGPCSPTSPMKKTPSSSVCPDALSVLCTECPNQIGRGHGRWNSHRECPCPAHKELWVCSSTPASRTQAHNFLKQMPFFPMLPPTVATQMQIERRFWKVCTLHWNICIGSNVCSGILCYTTCHRFINTGYYTQSSFKIWSLLTSLCTEKWKNWKQTWNETCWLPILWQNQDWR